MSKLYSKLMRVQSELKAPKNQYNKFGKYKYRSCEDIMEGVKPLLAREKLMLSVSDEVRQIGDRYYIEATATIICTEEGDRHEVKALAREGANKKGMDPAQLSGATSSYARKYALNGLFAIDDTKDADSTNKHGKGERGKQINNKPSNSKNDLITDKTKNEIEELLEKAHSKYEETKGEVDKSKLKGVFYKDFAKKKGWKKFFISDKTKESMAIQFRDYMKNRLGKLKEAS